MYSVKINTLIAALAITLVASVASAQNKSSMEGHGNMDHSSMNHSPPKSEEMDHSKMGHTMEANSAEATGVGVIHSISKLNRMVNLTHEPIPALNWPEMTMDLPVAKSVDLGSLKAGEKVTFHLKLGDDKKYVITHIMK